MTSSPALPLWHRISAVALLVFVTFFLVQNFFLAPLAQIELTKSERSDKEALRQRYGAIASMREELEAQKMVLEEEARQQQNYLQGATDALAAADLQAKIIPIAQRSGANIRRVQVLKQQPDAQGFQRVGLRVIALGKLGAMQTLVHTLEAAQPLLFIENIEFINRQGANPSNKVGRKRSDPDLQVQFDLFGYLAPVMNQNAKREGTAKGEAS